MDLKKWIQINKLTYEECALELSKILGRAIGAGTLYKWVHKTHNPRADVIQAIQKMTFGRVTLKDFVDKKIEK